MFKRKNSLLVVLAAVMAFALAAAFLLFSLPRTAEAERSSTAWTTIGEIYNDSTKGFYEDNLKKLYKALTGTDTYESVQSAANENKTSADFRTKNGGTKNVSVRFGGLKWDAVYLTTATNGDVILDLWQSADNVTTTAQFNVWTLKPNYPHSTDYPPDLTANYPSNMYSTSQIRVEALNAGGYYSTDKNTLVGEKQGQNSENQYARFTMSTLDNSLTKYIAKPSEVGYQATEYDSATAKAICNGEYYLPNDAYGTPTGGNWYSDNYGNYYTDSRDNSRADEAKYGAWQNDYLWLPSITEAGCGKNSLGDGNVSNGMWDTDDSLRSTEKSNGTTSTWLRSGFFSDKYYTGEYENCYYFVYIMGNTGTHADWTNDENDTYFVRPALHLNLTAANSNIKSIWKNIGEIYQDSSNSFDRGNMQALYTALTGTGSYGSVRTALSGGNKTSADFRAQNGGQNVTVVFGGIKWDAVYLTTAKNGDFILDLWQSADNVTQSSKYANWGVGDENPTDNYPSNMYSTSLIRVSTLNNGGYASSNSSEVYEFKPQTSNKYARFTMSSADNSLVQYIVQPSQVGYQETEFDETTANAYRSEKYYFPNDAYGTPADGGQWYSADYNYANGDSSRTYEQTKYGAWQNDYLWLPSMTETGFSDTGNGLWKTDASLRITVSANSKNYAWLRSGNYNNAGNAYRLNTSGGYSSQDIANSNLVRPAIHLNLTAINNSLKTEVEVPEDVTKMYNGSLQKSGIADDLYTVSEEGGTNVGSYDVTLTLKEPDDYKWKGHENETSVTVHLIITKALGNKWINGITLDGWTYGETPNTPTAQTMFGTENIKFTYTHDNSKTYYDEPPTNAGWYDVRASLDDTDNYVGVASIVKSFQIKPATLTLTGADVQTKTYDGTTTATIAAFTFEGYKYDDSNPTAINVAEYAAAYANANAGSSIKVTITTITLGGTAAGNYTVDLTSQGSAAITGIITPATLKIAGATVETRPYDGTKTANITDMSFDDIVKGDESKVRFLSCTAEFASPNASDSAAVGEITDVKLTGEAANNYTVDTSTLPTITGIIERATLNLPTPDTATYSGAKQEIAKLNSLATGVNEEILQLGDDYTVVYRGTNPLNTEPINADTYTVTVTLTSAKAKNYKFSSETVEYSATSEYIIVQMELTKPTGGSINNPYSGADQSITLDGFDGKTMKQESLTDGAAFVAESGTFGAKNKGEYTLEIGVLNGNYKWSGADQTNPRFKIVITAAPLTYSFTNSGEEYDEKEREVAIAFATQKGETLEKGTDYIINIEKGTGALGGGGNPLNAGSYTVTITLQNTTKANNYTLSSGNPTNFTIEKAELTKPTGTKTVEGIYSGTPYEITVTGYTDKMTAELSDSIKSSFESDKFTATNAGKYTLTISITDQNNYKWKDGESDEQVVFTINISKKELEKPEGSAGGKYNGENYVVTLSDYDNATMKTSDVPAGSTFEQDGGTWKFSARDVGTYSITVSLRYPDNYKWKDEGADPEITITIGKTELSFKLKQAKSGYNGNEHTDIDVDFTGDKDGMKITQNYELSFAATATGKLGVNSLPQGAGLYTVTLTLLGSAAQDYDLKVATATYEIVKADLTFELVSSSGGYTGTAHSDIDVNFTGIQNEEAFTKGTHYTLSFAAQSGTTAQLDGNLPKTVGKYTVAVALLGERDDNYNVTTVSQTYEINKAQITVSGEYIFSRDYNGEEYEYTITGAGSFNGLTVTMSVKDPSFEITIATVKSANTYTGNIAVEYDDVNFALTNSGTYTVTINKAKLTLSLTVDDGGKIYDGNATATVTGEIISGRFGTDNVTISSIKAHFDNANVGNNKPITVTQVTLGGTMADNYTVVISDFPKISGDIEQATIEVVWDGYSGLIYDGNPKTVTVSATGVLNESVELIITYVSDTPGIELVGEKPQNAGDYTATASTSNGNYALSENTKTYTVAKQQVNAPAIASKVYNGTVQIADVAASPLYTIENEGGTVVGDYTVTLTFTDGKNYKWVNDGTEYETDYIDLTFSITKATYDMSGVEFVGYSIIYDAQEHSIFISGVLPDGVTVTYDGNGQTAVGTYTVTAIFTGDGHNYNTIDNKTAELTILKVSHDLSGIGFDNVTVKHDGETHSIYIVGALPVNVTVDYEGNGQTEPNIYTVTAVFSDPDGVFAEKTATLTILRTQTQTESVGEIGTGGDTGDASNITVPEVFIDSEEGFDPTLELVVEKVENVERNYLAWGKDEVSERYTVKLCNKDGGEVPIEGKVTVRLLIPEAFREKDFDLMATVRGGAASADITQTVKATANRIGVVSATSIEFTRDGNYVVFEADGLSEYVFTSNYTPYFSILIIATGVLLADVAGMIALTVVIKKKRNTKVR